MKFNWEKGVVLAFVAFMLFIVYFLVKATVDETYNHELVTNDYYKQEIEYQNVIDITQKTKNQAMQVAISIEKNKGIYFIFPEQIQGILKEGTIYFYRPSDTKLDFQLPISLENNKIFVPNNILKKGRWNIDLDYKVRNQVYKTSFKITY